MRSSAIHFSSPQLVILIANEDDGVAHPSTAFTALKYPSPPPLLYIAYGGMPSGREFTGVRNRLARSKTGI